ncbi:MAG: hypothetical protein ACFCVK_20440 [Acidimicrobiales bacterium]
MTDGSAADFEDIATYHAIERFVQAPSGQWQSSQVVRTIQKVEGFGECLDVTLEPTELPDGVGGQSESG